MNNSPQIVVRNLRLHPEVAETIRERVDRLSRFFDRIVACRVAVEGPSRHHRHGLFLIGIELTVPRGLIAITHQRSDDLQIAIRDAFSAAERKLESHVRRLRGDVKSRAE